MNAAAAKIRVLLVDDHEVVRSGFRRLIEQSAIVCAEAADGEEAYRIYAQCNPDVTVMDLNMPGMGGLESLRRILARHASARVLVFSMHDSIAFVNQALRAGARGYITKASAADVLITGIEAVARGERYLSPDLAQRISLADQGESNPLSQLTAREFELFRLFAEGRTVDDIAAALNISQKTVANYQTQIRQKLNIASAVDLVRLALRYGVIV
jgi:DNA-binding NarL/FixJ family response regulator